MSGVASEDDARGLLVADGASSSFARLSSSSGEPAQHHAACIPQQVQSPSPLRLPAVLVMPTLRGMHGFVRKKRLTEFVEADRVQLCTLTELVRLATDHHRRVVSMGCHRDHRCAGTPHCCSVVEHRNGTNEDFGHVLHDVRHRVQQNVGALDPVRDETRQKRLPLQPWLGIHDDDANTFANTVGSLQHLLDHVRVTIGQDRLARIDLPVRHVRDDCVRKNHLLLDVRVYRVRQGCLGLLLTHRQRQRCDLPLQPLDGVAHADRERAAANEEPNGGPQSRRQVSRDVLARGRGVLVDQLFEAAQHGNAAGIRTHDRRAATDRLQAQGDQRWVHLRRRTAAPARATSAPAATSASAPLALASEVLGDQLPGARPLCPAAPASTTQLYAWRGRDAQARWHAPSSPCSDPQPFRLWRQRTCGW